MGSTLDAGRAAEDRVDREARARGWRTLERNYRVRAGELDLVYDAHGLIVIVEVRYRARRDYGGALASVTPHKQRRIIQAARYLLAARPKLARMPIRFDVVGVDADNTLDWIENAFYAE